MEAKAWTDPVSGVPYSLLSLGVRYFFSDSEYPGGPRKKLTTPCPELTARNILSTGSATENLNLPDMIELRTWKHLSNTDIDSMICQNIDDRLVFIVENHSQHEGLKPGHVYLRVPLTTYLPRELISYLYLWKYEFYIRNDIFSDSILLLDRLVSRLHSTEGFKTSIFEKDTSLGLSWSHGPRQSDTVPCMAIQWPEDAGAWRGRKREHGWPTMQMIERVLVNGCHLVSKPHPFSACQAIEWRYSFSMAELRLAETLDHLQRVSYKVFKALIKYHEKTCGLGISSYYLKNTFFWVCEQSPRSTWTLNNLGRSFLCLLDKLLEFLQGHNLPHYFIPEHNLIEHLPSEAIKRWVTGVEYIRRHPLLCMEDFHSKYTSNLFLGAIKNIQFIGNMMQNVYRSLRGLVSTSSENSSLIHVRVMLMWFGIYYGVECQHSMMLSLAKVLFYAPNFSSGRDLTIDEGPTGNLQEELYLLNENYRLCIQQLESNESLKCLMDKMCERKCERLLSALQAEVACLFYQMSRNSGTAREEFRKEAEYYFRSAIEHENGVWTSLVKYAQYLVHLGRYDEAYPLLQKVIREPVKYEGWDHSTYIVYSKYTDESVETTLKALHAIEEQEVCYHAHALSYYLLYICRKELGRDPGDYCIPECDEYGHVLDSSSTYLYWICMTFFRACLLLRYGHVHTALCVFMVIQNDLKAIYFIWYTAAKLFCTYFEEWQSRLV